MKRTNKDFKFYFPLEIKKSQDSEDSSKMRLGGIASTMDEDSDGEFLDPKGFVLDEFLEFGLVNWHHQAKDKPATIIGEPYVAEIRKDGLYVECDLYPDSLIAREVYQLAQVMEKNSKTRKLGFSIEGNVLEKDEDNPKIIKKAVITGLAITHMPKNPSTFAQVLKGKFSSDLHTEDSEEKEEKSIDTESASALKRESVDGYVFKEMTEEKTYDEIFKSHPDLDVETAEKVYTIISKMKEAMSKAKINDEQLSKAMGVLGFESDLNKNPFLEKGKKKFDKSPEEVAQIVQDELFEKEDDEDDEIEKSEEENTTGIQKSKKSEVNGTVLLMKKMFGDVFEKGMKENFQRQSAIGVLVKAVMEQNENLNANISELLKSNQENLSKIESLREELELTKGFIAQELGNEVPARRSITKGYLEKESFAKARDLGNDVSQNTLSKSKDYKKVLDLLDGYCEQNGMRQDLSKAVIEFEATKNLPMNVINEIQSKLNINIVD